MKSTSKVIMGATLVMGVSLAMVLGLILVLLAELYCTLLLRRRQLRITTTTTTAIVTTPTAITSPNPDASPLPQNSQPQQNKQFSPQLTGCYTQGVLQAARTFLFPAASCEENSIAGPVNKHSQLHHVLEVHAQDSSPKPKQIVLTRTSPPSKSPGEISVQIPNDIVCKEKSCALDEQLFVYISNPIYDNEASRPGRVETPFETPDSSPSRLEAGGSSGDEGTFQESPSSPTVTLPLTPMKKVPAEASSISLKDARSLCTSGSDSVSHNGLSSSSSESPRTSPSWSFHLCVKS